MELGDTYHDRGGPSTIEVAANASVLSLLPLNQASYLTEWRKLVVGYIGVINIGICASAIKKLLIRH